MNKITFPVKILLISQLIGMICLWMINWVKAPILIFIFFGLGAGLIALSLLLWIWLIIRDIKKELFIK
jgi:hypothetical protein